MAHAQGTRSRKRKRNPFELDRMLTMQEAMEYLTFKGFPCRQRSTFYKLLRDFNIPYTVTNPGGRYEIRRFPLSGIEDFLRKQGLKP